MKLTIVAGSHRRESESARVAHFIEDFVRSGMSPDFDSIHLLDLGRQRLPLWDEDLQKPELSDPRWREIWADLSAELSGAHAFVFVTPEWSGMVPPALKNLLILCSQYELAHKPALIISISSGVGGAYPVAELRANSSKDTMICYIPEQVIIRQVALMLHGPGAQNVYDAAVRKRIVYALRLLHVYAQALLAVRESGVIDNDAFPFGM